jgi:hypothetical protein
MAEDKNRCRQRSEIDRTCYDAPMYIPKQAKRWYLVMVFCVLLSFFAFAVGPVIGYSMDSIQHVGLMIAVWAPTLGILGVRAELLQRREQDRMK